MTVTTSTTPAPDATGRAPEAVGLDRATKRYGAVAALDGVSLSVGDGEFVTLLGPSGSGKTTCLQIMAGITRPDDGTVRIAGRDVRRVPMHKRNIGMVFQSYALFPHLDVASNVLYPLRTRGWSKERALRAMREALALVRLTGFEERRPDQLSGGQQQRVALARAIVFEPSVLLLDEPLSALDRLLREEMQLELRRVHELTGMATVCVTHDRSEALTMSDRVVLLDGGRIVQEGTPREMYDDSATLFAAQFLGEVNRFAMTLRDGVLSDGARTLRSTRAATVPEGDVDVAFRVENVRLEPAGDERGDEAWTGVVRDTVFLGEGMRYVVDLGGGSVVARVARGLGPVAFVAGDRVRVRVAPSEVMVFPAAG
ncbi:ATP-binding cassette domain-containing protein [Nocardioides sp. dk4132]|uniref:ABC transporter ATP-binding protein n=1 Tax=unclassified Nocardioides TaxID=2615069 RepID=UPI00129770FA|nr:MULTISPECIES: ABC transporter ATP-binding protein [unclassified Nocardioides]MQW76395.1 ATP-binding cassette domain-containing protein [Nocardioides sp. dk4132]